MARILPAILCLLSACSTPSGGAGGVSTVSEIQPSGAQLRTEISSIVVDTSERAGRRVINLDLRNDTERSIRFAWAVEWMDKTGATLQGTPAGWHPTRLEPGAVTPIELEAPHSRAASWRLIAVETVP